VVAALGTVAGASGVGAVDGALGTTRAPPEAEPGALGAGSTEATGVEPAGGGAAERPQPASASAPEANTMGTVFTDRFTALLPGILEALILAALSLGFAPE
jgi:hypothetical protein